MCKPYIGAGAGLMAAFYMNRWQKDRAYDSHT
jgi:hypothetical protein